MLTKLRPSRARTVMQLTGTVEHSKLRLSFQVVAAARLTVLTLQRASSPRPTLSAVTRAALLDYAKKVERMTPTERAREARHVGLVSRAWLPEADAMQRATDALQAAEGSPEVPLPSLAEVTCAPQGPTPQELDLAVNRLLKQAMPRKYAHLPTQ